VLALEGRSHLLAILHRQENGYEIGFDPKRTLVLPSHYYSPKERAQKTLMPEEARMSYLEGQEALLTTEVSD